MEAVSVLLPAAEGKIFNGKGDALDALGDFELEERIAEGSAAGLDGTDVDREGAIAGGDEFFADFIVDGEQAG